VKFQNFYVNDGKPTLFLKSTKTGKEDEYYIDQEILDMVNAVKKSRGWVNHEIEKCQQFIADSTMRKEQKEDKRLRLHILKRRQDHVFSFFSCGAVQKNLQKFREFLKKRGI
jgi:hypothetical protein